MKGVLLKIKNAFLYSYYECYLQEHHFVKEHRDKNFNANATLGVVIDLLILIPILILINKTIGIKKYMYIILVIIAYGQIYLTSWIVGEGDLTDQINSFYENKRVVKESRMIVWGFVLLCIAFWTFVIMYNEY